MDVASCRLKRTTLGTTTEDAHWLADTNPVEHSLEDSRKWPIDALSHVLFCPAFLGVHYNAKEDSCDAPHRIAVLGSKSCRGTLVDTPFRTPLACHITLLLAEDTLAIGSDDDKSSCITEKCTYCACSRTFVTILLWSITFTEALDCSATDSIEDGSPLSIRHKVFASSNLLEALKDDETASTLDAFVYTAGDLDTVKSPKDSTYADTLIDPIGLPAAEKDGLTSNSYIKILDLLTDSLSAVSASCLCRIFVTSGGVLARLTYRPCG